MIKCERVFQEQLNKIPCLKSPAERRGVVTMHDLQRALTEKLASKPSLRQRRCAIPTVVVPTYVVGQYGYAAPSCSLPVAFAALLGRTILRAMHVTLHAFYG